MPAVLSKCVAADKHCWPPSLIKKVVAWAKQKKCLCGERLARKRKVIGGGPLRQRTPGGRLRKGTMFWACKHWRTKNRHQRCGFVMQEQRMIAKYLQLFPEEAPWEPVVLKWKCKAARAFYIHSPTNESSPVSLCDSSSSEDTENEEMMETLGYNERTCWKCKMQCRDMTGTVNWDEESDTGSTPASLRFPSPLNTTFQKADRAMRLHRGIVHSKVADATRFMEQVDRIVGIEFRHIHEVERVLTCRELVYKKLRQLNPAVEFPTVTDADVIRVCEMVEDPFHLNAYGRSLSAKEAVTDISGGVLTDILRTSQEDL